MRLSREMGLRNICLILFRGRQSRN